MSTSKTMPDLLAPWPHGDLTVEIEGYPPLESTMPGYSLAHHIRDARVVRCGYPIAGAIEEFAQRITVVAFDAQRSYIKVRIG